MKNYKLNLSKFAVYLGFLTLPFTSVFSFSSQISLSAAAFSCAVIILLFSGRGYIAITNGGVNNFIISISAAGIMLPVVSLILSLNLHSEIRVGHVLARTLFYFLIFGGVIFIRAFARCGLSQTKKIIELTYFLIIIFCIIDALNLFRIIDINLGRGNVEHLAVSFGDLYRIRGPFEEPSYLGAFVAATLPIYLFISKKRAFKFIVVSGVTVLLSLSANFVFWFFIYLLLWVLFILPKIIRLKLLTRSNVATFLFIASFILISVFEFNIFGIIYGKFLGNSFSERIESYSIISDFINHPLHIIFGFGPGYFLSTNFSQPTSIVVSTFIELGLLGLLIFFCIYFINIFMLFKKPAAMHLTIGCISYFIFIMTTPGYYFPFYVLPLLYWTFYKASLLWPLKNSFS